MAGFCMNCGGSRDTSRWERAEPADAEDLGGARTSRLHRKGTCVPVELWRGGLCGLGSFRNGRRGDRGEVVPVDFERNDGSVPEKLGSLGAFGVSGHFATGQKAKAPSEDRKGPRRLSCSCGRHHRAAQWSSRRRAAKRWLPQILPQVFGFAGFPRVAIVARLRLLLVSELVPALESHRTCPSC